MKAHLEFELPEENCEFELAHHGMDFALTCQDIDEQLRHWLKYGHEFKAVDEALEAVRENLRKCLESYGVSLDMIE